jgi:hypothetical protein
MERGMQAASEVLVTFHGGKKRGCGMRIFVQDDLGAPKTEHIAFLLLRVIARFRITLL